MFDYGVSIGLDIGTELIKIAAIMKKRNKYHLICLGSVPTPAETIKNGFIHDPEVMARHIRDLFKKINIKRGRLTSSVAGNQVYTRLMKMPDMDTKAIKKASFYQASSFLPVSIDEVTTDVFPVRYFEDEEGAKVEVFFVAAHKKQVENLYQTCKLAGLKLSYVEIEPIALYRVFQPLLGDENEQAVMVVNIGADLTYMALFIRGLLVSIRNTSLGCYALQSNSDATNSTLKTSGMGYEPQYLNKYLNELSMEVKHTIEYFIMQSGGLNVEKIIICGGGARLPGIKNHLSVSLHKQIEFGQLNRQLLLSEKIDDDRKKSLYFEYPVAVGLALRGIF